MDFTEHSFLQVFFIVLWILMPAYLSNTFAVITGGKFPIDQGKIHSDGNRILGDGKTWSGLIGGTFGGVVIGYLQINHGNIVIDTIANSENYSFWGENSLVIIFLLAFGALLGDMTASFFKRRKKLKRGDKSPLLDMFDFIGMALFLTLIFDPIWLKSWILDGYAPLFTILIATPLLHRSVNIIGYKLGIKNEPW